MRNLLRPLSFLPALLLMYVIYSFSGQDGEESGNYSGSVSEAAVRIAAGIMNKTPSEDRIRYYADRIEGAVRKAAHVAEYFALAVAVAFPLYVYGIRGLLLLFLAGILCLSFAGFDEYRQSFIPGRHGSIRDVGVDGLGVLAGITCVRMIGWTGRMTIFKKNKNRI